MRKPLKKKQVRKRRYMIAAVEFIFMDDPDDMLQDWM